MDKRVRTIVFSFLLVLFIILIGFLTYAYTSHSFLFKPQTVHFHAGFQVYVDNKLQDFSNFRYMDVTPCNASGLASEDQQEVKAHLHEQVGDVVHVHRSGVVWKDLFINLKFQPILKTQVDGYINGEKIADPLNYPIKAYDSAIFFVGKHDAISTYLRHAVTVTHIKEIEKHSELCGTSSS